MLSEPPTSFVPFMTTEGPANGGGPRDYIGGGPRDDEYGGGGPRDGHPHPPLRPLTVAANVANRPRSGSGSIIQHQDCGSTINISRALPTNQVSLLFIFALIVKQPN